MNIIMIIVFALIVAGILASDHIGKFLEHRLILKGAELDIKKLEAEATLLKLKADPKFQEREEFVRDAIEAHKDLM